MARKNEKNGKGNVTPVTRLRDGWEGKRDEKTPEGVVEYTDEVSILKGQIILLQNQLRAATEEKYRALAQLELQPVTSKQSEILASFGVADGEAVNLNITDAKVTVTRRPKAE